MKRNPENRVLVLGANGMLGRYVYKYLSSSLPSIYEVVPGTRDDFDITFKSVREIKDYIFSAITKGNKSIYNDLVINCVGAIKPVIDLVGVEAAFDINSLFPRKLGKVLEDLGINGIHVNTDCIYGGAQGGYVECNKLVDYVSPADVYGCTKLLGEDNGMTNIRTSIIGEEVGNGRSLVEWLKSEAGKEVNGFTNHYWNGMTCLQFAKIVEELIPSRILWRDRCQHLFSNTVTKYELLEMLSEIYELNVTVKPVKAKQRVDRTLATLDMDTIAKFNIPSIRDQIIEMKNFSLK